jgi:hypothetical protein
MTTRIANKVTMMRPLRGNFFFGLLGEPFGVLGVLAPLSYRLFEWTVAVVPGTHRDAGAFAGGSAR